ncbi:flavin-containing monooxygenase [Grosmannia clavigera kw1407]|uniref:Flavin-containing monooxygenase n=1 Tax=Grosmannia clavigera (strain kw1407 / UAMH 11150) TaxID=655863 RepID=F0XS43_GROCL|nr:flavin-containing monooxygenase [Grosmannia clavigera kw1407]EFW99508.1 flavin-containing monooxygenase [Grosmannia clavigera kw1407]
MTVPIKRVAVIGAGPAGAIAVDALAQEKVFTLIRGFERREGPGGCWIGDTSPPPPLTGFEALANRTADQPVPVPSTLPAVTPKLEQPRFAESSVYPYLETNVDSLAMAFSQEPIPAERSAWSVAMHGEDTPFRPWRVMRDYVEGLLSRRGYESVFAYGTTVERAAKIGNEWELTLRRSSDDGEDATTDYWWTERFDAVVVASGHYAVPYVPAIDGLEAFAQRWPGSVLHSKQYRGRDAFAGKRVVVVGASVSAADIAVDLVGTAQSPVHAVVLGHVVNGFFGDGAFGHPDIRKQQSIGRVCADTRTVFFVDGSSVADVDLLLFGTGYSWTLPFLPQVAVRNNRVPDLYQHVVWQHDPTLLFVGAVGAGLTFKIFEWQAVYAARLLTGRASLPPLADMRRWEADRIRDHGDGPKFTVIHPDFEEYFETLRQLAGNASPDAGRPLPPFRQEWFRAFMDGHERRKAMWQRNNEAAVAARAPGVEEAPIKGRL